ncbi:hypothetical protein B0O99DRAFT_674833 [Bisporella sp. PMI_857]|nr:hypothetical protein B0O99DRAFT_674833 [Bisporella sp. PMI_857]
MESAYKPQALASIVGITKMPHPIFTPLIDVVFMSLDIEGRNVAGNSRIGEIGVSIFDTRQLEEKSELISSRHSCTGTDINTSSPAPQKIEAIKTLLLLLGHWKIVLIGHGIRNDLVIVVEFQVNVQDMPPVVGVVNTEATRQAVYRKGLKLVVGPRIGLAYRIPSMMQVIWKAD